MLKKILFISLAVFFLLTAKSYAFTRQYGNPSASVVIVEYSDYECPYCGTYELKVLPKLIKKYRNEVLFAFRDLPLTNIHPYALQAAETADCAYYQDRYFTVRYLLYKYQSEWAKNGNIGRYIANAVNVKRLIACLTEGAEMPMLKSNAEYDVKNKLYETPTFKVYKNGRLVQTILGAQSYKYMDNMIKQILR
jgi:protein-disulfide isomerase